MRKSVFILLAILLCFALIVSCNDNPADDGSDSVLADNMTESYRNARQGVYNASQIWLPKLEGVEVILKEVEEEGHWINVAFGGDADLFSQIADVFQKGLNTEPLFDTSEMKMWDNLTYTDNGQVYVGNITVFFDSKGPSAPAVGISCHFFKGSTVELKATAGGTVVLKQAGNAVPGNKVTTAVNSDLDLVAMPEGGYQFAGWFIGETKISDAATYHDYKVPSSNVVIEARFTESPTTAYYSALQGVFSRVFGVTLPAIAGIDATAYAEGDTAELNDITTADELKTWISGPSGTNPACVIDLVNEDDDVVAEACITLLDAFNGFVAADGTHWRNSGEELKAGSGYYTAYYCTEPSLGEWTFDMAVMVYTEGDLNYPSIDFNIWYPAES